MAAVFANLREERLNEDAGAVAGPLATVIIDRSTIPDYVLLFTVVMGSAFIGELFPPHIANLIRTHPWAKHLTALALLVVTIVWVRADMSVPLLIGYTAITYAWYLATTSMAAAEFATVIAFLFVVFASSHLRQAEMRRAVLADVVAKAEAKTDGVARVALTQTPSSNSSLSRSPGPSTSTVKPRNDMLDWRYWLEFAALTGAAGATMLFTAKHVLTKFIEG